MSLENRISFIIPTCNSQNYITDCLKSIRDQAYPKEKIEIIVVDNSSRDETVSLAKKIADKVIPNAKDTIATVRNIGARAAKGDFLVFVDSDCVIQSDWTRKALEWFTDPTVGMTGAKNYLLPDTASWIERSWKIHLDRDKYDKDSKWVASRAMIVRKEAHVSVEGFDEGLITCEDVDYGYRMGAKYRVILDERLAPLHLKLTRDLVHFFHVQTWRGNDNLKISLRHINQLKELLYILYILYYTILVICLFPVIAFTIYAYDLRPLAIILVGLFVPMFLAAFNVCRKAKDFSHIGKLMILYSIYFLAKIKAVFMVAWKK